MPSILQGRDRKGANPSPTGSSVADVHHPEHDEGTGETHSHLVSHGDGTHHIEHEDGTQTDHPHIGHALMHLAAKHSEGMHHHTHADGMGGEHTTHTAAHGEGPMDGEHHGPITHANASEVGEHLKQFFDEEAAEPDEGGEMEGKSGGRDYD